MRFSKLSATIALMATLSPLVVHADDDRVNFSRDVRPILSNRCFKCHGFDPTTREAGLRLDTRSGLFDEHNGFRPFVAGNAADSEALRRVLSTDDDERMPPPSAKKDLTPREKEILQKWVEQGTPWESHWAFEKPVRPPVPQEGVAGASSNPIDSFIRKRLADAGLKPSPEADRQTLIRRVTLDLTGLPPTPEEADAFANDHSPDAYEKLVDLLLKSPAYGERWARRWLDLARYADTNGYEKDRARTIWPYRDWVVTALNSNMPFDQFTIKQIAGDMLPDATESDLIATGFHRNTMLNEEGGIDPLEFRFHAMTDRVATTGVTWLGLTTGCAQCHSHKYDPISHTEYFGLMAFLNNADEVELPLNTTSAPVRELVTPDKVAAQVEVLLAAWPLPKTDDKSPDATTPKPTPQELAEIAFQAWLKKQHESQVDWVPLAPTKLSSNLPLLTLTEDNIVFVTGDITKQDTYEISARPQMKAVTALRIEALPDPRLPGGGPGMTYYEGRKGDFFLTNMNVLVNGQHVKIASAQSSYGKNAFGSTPATADMVIDDNLQSGWGVADRPGERHVAVFRFAEPVDIDTLDLELLFGRHFASSLGKFRISLTTGHEPSALDVSPEAEQLLARPYEDLTPADLNTLRLAFLLQAPELAKPAAAARKNMTPPAPLTTLVFHERPPENPRPTHRHNRGEYLQPQEEVPPLTPAFLNPLPEGAPRNRLTFARWLVARDNPLTARVVVNQQWAALFGRGIVPTVQDFGFQGDLPSHPRLLDWLAVEFMDSGWDMKHLHRLIVTSAVYRQASKVTEQSHEADPSNILLSHAPRLRLEAEIIRDSALAASGLLVDKLGGPPVKPPQPNSVTEAAYGNFKWESSTGEDRYRRSLYTFIKRTAPFAMFSVFDAPSGESCLARRDVSNTPLQGLTLLNDEMYQEIAVALGKRAQAHADNDRDRAHYLFRLVLTRSPSDEELNDLTTFVTTQRPRFATHADEARQLTALKDDTALKLAPWVALARAILSLDETITRN